MCINVLSVESMGDVVMFVDLIDHPVRIVLSGRSEYHNLVVLRHLPQEFIRPWPHQEFPLVLALLLVHVLTSE